MIYRCQACGRKLLTPAFTAPASMGGWMLGPKCAAKATALPGMSDKPKPAKACKPRRVRAEKPVAGRVKKRRAGSLVLPGQMELDLLGISL